MIQGDLTTLPQLFVRNPGWHVMFDMDAPKAEETRRRVYDRLAADKMPVQGYHFPFPAMAYIEKSGIGYREIPVIVESDALIGAVCKAGRPPSSAAFFFAPTSVGNRLRWAAAKREIERTRGADQGGIS